jgi:acetyl-CoA C-acetyltransferase
MNDVYIYDHIRTPRGKGRASGALHEVTPVQLATRVLAALRERNAFSSDTIGDVGLGVVMPLGEQGADLTRTALLQAGYGDTVPGFQLNRFCTSALDTVNMVAGAIMSGQISGGIGGGVESMSRVGIGSDGGACYTDPQVTRQYAYIPNGVCADLMAALGGFTREQIDAYSVESQRRAAHARSAGYFSASLAPVYDILGELLLGEDEAVRGGTSMADLAKLAPAFTAVGEQGFDALALQRYPQLASIPHVHTSGSSSGIVDGACAILLGDRDFGERHGLKPRARIRGFLSMASEPNLSLGGPMPVTRKLLAREGMAASDIDLYEVNEAFAVVPLTYMREFDIGHERVNVNGGAIALGHPLGATGAMLLGTVLDELERRDQATGLVTLCAAIGQSSATIIERV